jgi:molybdopterin-guanine dinucleotide biosynthesis protein A
MPSFSAVLLAGGKSTRMGRDKALLPLPDSGLLLWRRQLGLLEELQPEQIFWSGPLRPGLPESLCVVADKVPNAGPLAGISACLDAMQSDLLIVLAIDLRQMTAVFLRGLLQRCSPTQGTVIHHGDFFEPLAAIYPKGVADLARKHLSSGRYALQDLLAEIVRQKGVQAISMDEKILPLFQNWNEPEPSPKDIAHPKSLNK